MAPRLTAAARPLSRGAKPVDPPDFRQIGCKIRAI
jgi:hypothetical protein